MMSDESSEIIDSVVDESATLNKYITLIKAEIGRMCLVGKFSKLAYSSLDSLSYIGEYTVVINSTIGKFTSISWGVTIGPEEHDYTRITNHSFLYSTKSFRLVKERMYSPFVGECKIGNDVWIGCNSTILRGLQIGDGAVIGANSLVNKDIPPYAIAVGNPAKVIKYRFHEEIISQLVELQWWDLPLDVISENARLFSENPTHTTLSQIRHLKYR